MQLRRMMQPVCDISLSRVQLAILLCGQSQPGLVDEVATDGSSVLTFARLCEAGVSVARLEAAGLGPLFLYHCGARSAEEIQAFGYTSLHLAASSRVCNEAVLAYGEGAVIAGFLKTAEDAVNVAGSPAQACLGLMAKDLLKACKNSPEMGISVLLQIPRQVAFVGLCTDDIMECGIRAVHLIAHGFKSSTLSLQMNARSPELCRLGFYQPAFFTQQ